MESLSSRKRTFSMTSSTSSQTFSSQEEPRITSSSMVKPHDDDIIDKNIKVKIQKMNNDDICEQKDTNSISSKTEDNKSTSKTGEEKDMNNIVDTIYTDSIFVFTPKTAFLSNEACSFLNVFEDMPIGLSSFFNLIINEICDKKNLLNISKNVDEFNQYKKGLITFDKEMNIYCLYDIKPDILQLFKSDDVNIHKCLSPNSIKRFKQNISKKDIYTMVLSHCNNESIYLTEKYYLTNNLYDFFEIDKTLRLQFTIKEIIAKISKYIYDNKLISKVDQRFIIMDQKLNKLFNTNKLVNIKLLTKLIRQHIVPTGSLYYEKIINNISFSDIKIIESCYALPKDGKNGIYRKYNINGNLILETYYTNDIEDGVRRRWDNNGNLRSICEYVNNKKNGNYIIFDEYYNILVNILFKNNIVINMGVSE